MQTESTTPSDAETRTSSPRSAKRVLLYFALGMIGSLALIILLIGLFSSPGPTPLEQKLLGRWMTISPSGEERVFTFRSDGTVFYRTTSPTPNSTDYFWNADGTTVRVSYQQDWWTDFWQRFTGSDTQIYEILFHDDDTFELHVGTPTGQELFQRIEE